MNSVNVEAVEQASVKAGQVGDKARWPFMFVKDKTGNKTGWIVLHAPIQSPSRMDMYTHYRRQGYRFIGMTSFMTYPNNSLSDNVDYGAICEGWAHCFRQPKQYLPEQQPSILLPFSDFTDPFVISQRSYRESSTSFDFLYLGANSEWKMQAKNWQLAQKCIPLFCEQLGLRGIAVGVDPKMVPYCRNLTISPWLAYDEFLGVLGACRFLFVPNINDASPRVLSEALCLNVPIIVNHEILGGWHYVNRKSGLFFNDEQDVVQVVEQCLENKFQTRTWFLNQFGPRRSGLKLKALIKECQPDISTNGPFNLGY